MNIQVKLSNQAMTLSTPVSNAIAEEFVDGMMIHGDNFFFCLQNGDIETREDQEDRTVYNLKNNITVTIHYLFGPDGEDKDD